MTGASCAVCERPMDDAHPEQAACLDCINDGACGYCGATMHPCDCGHVDGVWDDGPQDTRGL